MAESFSGAILRQRKRVIPLTTHVHRHLRWPRINVSPVALGVVALLAVAGAVGVLIGRGTKESATPASGLASAKVVAMVDGSLAALNRGDWDAFAKYWAKDAVLEDAAIPTVARGRQEIVGLNEGIYNLGARYYRVGPVIQRGDLAAYAVSCPNCPGAWSGIDLIQFDQSFRATHLWTGNTAGRVAAPSTQR